MAYDAGFFAAREYGRMLVRCALALAREIHVFELMAVAALERIVCLHARPFVLRKLEALVEKLFAGVYGAEYFAPHLFGPLHLAPHLVSPVVRHVAIRTFRAHARTVGEVDRAFEFGIDVF